MNITVYLSSRTDIDDDYKQAVRKVGQGIGEMKARLIYGGSNAGQMHELAASAKAAGATVTGIIPEAFRHLSDPIVNDMIYTLDLNERKMKLIALSQIFVALPGGIGTLDEIMSTLAELVILKDYTRPIIIVNINGLFNPLLAQLESFVRQNLAATQAVDIIKTVNTADECINLIKNLQKQP